LGNKVETNSSKNTTKTFTSGVRSAGGSGPLLKFDTAQKAYDNSLKDVTAKFNGGSSWTKPEMPLITYISTYAPASDKNDPVAYTKHMVDRFNQVLGKDVINSNTTLIELKQAIKDKGLNPEKTITEAHLSLENPAVLKELKLNSSTPKSNTKEVVIDKEKTKANVEKSIPTVKQALAKKSLTDMTSEEASIERDKRYKREKDLKEAARQVIIEREKAKLLEEYKNKQNSSSMLSDYTEMAKRKLVQKGIIEPDKQAQSIKVV